SCSKREKSGHRKARFGFATPQRQLSIHSGGSGRDTAIGGHQMNWRHYVGSVLYKTKHFFFGSRFFPLTRYVPHGLSWPYDVQRYSGTRDLEVLFDVGANIGETAWEMTMNFPRAKIFCFEPVSSSYKMLCMRNDKMKNVRCVQLALG